MKISCFLPCRKGSERVVDKNIRPFASHQNGLIEIKLKQLSKVKEIDKIVLSTDDDYIINYAKGLKIENLVIHKRDASLSSSQTSTDDLIIHANSLINDGHILWTHVTSPFLNTELYSKIIKSYTEGLEKGYDSLMTTSLIKGFIWDEEGPLNYNRSVEKWPRTQTLTPIHEINSGVFIASADIYKGHKDRIGKNPQLFPLNKVEGSDIDWPEDFKIAECLLNANIGDI